MECIKRDVKPKPIVAKSRRAKKLKPQGKKVSEMVHDFSEVTVYEHTELFGEGYSPDGFSSCCKPSYQTVAWSETFSGDSSSVEFLRAFSHADSIPPEMRSPHMYKGCRNSDASWIGRFTYSSELNMLMPSNANRNSVFLKGVTVCSMCEFR